ncbi:MAG: helix-turn-helix domain-containing protein [Chloroflexus sp.]|nr:helix-turn-helix domain-containing protein [Chloroflexus sp.]
MILHKFDVINHPVRMRIFQTLYGGPYSINQLSRLLPDVPRPSLYRHIHKMLDAGIIRVAATRHINGIEERFFTPVFGQIKLAEIRDEEGKRKMAEHVSMYGWVVAQDLARYLLERDNPSFDDILAHDFTFYATDEEFHHIRNTIYQLLQEAEQQPRTDGRTLRRVFVLGYPLATLPHETLDGNDSKAE